MHILSNTFFQSKVYITSKNLYHDFSSILSTLKSFKCMLIYKSSIDFHARKFFTHVCVFCRDLMMAKFIVSRMSRILFLLLESVIFIVLCILWMLMRHVCFCYAYHRKISKSLGFADSTRDFQLLKFCIL